MAYKLGSLFDGSGGFPLSGALCGIEPRWAAEVEPYPIAVTRTRFPNMKHLGDISKVSGAEIEPVDIITFGSPCQDLSVAGKRAGLKHEANGDEETTRSGLFMEAVRIIKEMREATNGQYPRFALWENVPGAFSSNNGNDFRVVCEELIKIVEPAAFMSPVPKNGWAYADSYVGDGWSLAYRTFDAQYWGVPQRRRRIHLIADFRGECAREVLFERQGVRGYFETGRTPWQAAPCHAEDCTGAADREGEGEGAAGGRGQLDAVGFLRQLGGVEVHEDLAPTLMAAAGMSGNNKPCVAYSFDSLASNSMKSSNPHSGCREVKVAKTLDTTDPNPCKNQGGIAIVSPMSCYDIGDRRAVATEAVDVSPTLTSKMGTGGNNVPVIIAPEMYEWHNQDSRITGPIGVACTLNTNAGGREGHLVMEQKVFRKGARPHNAEEAQKWEDADVANTLNTFDQGEARANELVVEQMPVYCLQGNGIDRADTAGCNGAGWREGASYTLNTIDRPAVAYLASGKDTVGTLMANAGTKLWLGKQEAFSGDYHIIEEKDIQYIVRRLTPTECARLQGFADRWGDVEEKDSLTPEEFRFWHDVRNTHAAINGKKVQDYTEAQILIWYNKLHTDSAEYKMWGNGIALPPALYCMQGIVDALNREEEDEEAWWL